MRSFRLVCFAIALLMSATFVNADDLIILELENKFQEGIATSVLDHGFTRDGNRFLAGASAEQIDLLVRAGIKFEYVQSNYDPSTTALIGISCGPGNLHDHQKLSLPTDEVMPGLRLIETNRSDALRLNEDNCVYARLLEDANIRFLYLPPVVSQFLKLTNSYPTDSLTALVDVDSMVAMDQRLVDFQTRFVGTDSLEAARDWIMSKFQSWGYTDVSLQPLWTPYGTMHNVVCVKQGFAEPDVVIVIGGHYDSVTYGQPTPANVYAPGADDDGSGTVLTMELARILADVPTRKTIIFMPFTAEEIGLYGSTAAAADFVANGTNLEVMLNYDMVGYEPNPTWRINHSSGPNGAYRDLAAATTERVSSIIPVITSPGGSSDHAPFKDQGFNIINNIENTFNFNAWHTDTDIIDSMNVPYWVDVTKSALATLAIIANSAHPTDIEALVDQGDGKSVEVVWSNCDPTYAYTVSYWSTLGGDTTTVVVPGGNCSWVVDGLNEGEMYGFAVTGEAPDGYPAVYSVQAEEMSLVNPREITSLTSEPELNQISVDWADNPEADIDFYRVYRAVGDLPFVLYLDNVASSELTDVAVQSQVKYRYQAAAVDFDGNESPRDTGNYVSSYAATFDGGVLVADEMVAGSGMPPESIQEIYFDDLLGSIAFNLESVNENIERATAGRFSTILWFDDDLNNKQIGNAEDTLEWYLSFTNNMMITGLRTLEFWTASPLGPGDLAYDQFKISSYTVHDNFDFVGATGQNGWPNAVTDLGSPLGALPYVATFDLVSGPGVVPIFLYDSQTDDPASEGEICGAAFNGPDGYRILLGFPLYWLTDESAQAIIAHTLAVFGETTGTAEFGDLDENGLVDIADLVFMVAYMFQQGPAPADINSADVDGSCQLDIADLLYLVEYMFRSGPEPVAGCIE